MWNRISNTNIETKVINHLNKVNTDYTRNLYKLFGKNENLSLNKFRLLLIGLEKEQKIFNKVSGNYTIWEIKKWVYYQLEN